MQIKHMRKPAKKQAIDFYSIVVPSKIENSIDKGYINISMVSGRFIEAKERILQFFSMLHRESIDDINGWVRIHSKTLQKILGDRYKEFIAQLEIGSKIKGVYYPYIEVDPNYIVGEKCKGYRTGSKYLNKGTTIYTMTNLKANQLFYDMVQPEAYSECVIAEKLMSIYYRVGFLELPELYEHGKDLMKQKFEHNGKRLVSCVESKQSRATLVKRVAKHNTKMSEYKLIQLFNKYCQDFDHHIAHYTTLLKSGLRMPKWGRGSKDRVYDSINNLPKWIRDTLTIDGEQLFEVDLVNIHFHIAVSLIWDDLPLKEKAFLDELGTDVATGILDHIELCHKISSDCKYGTDWTRAKVKKQLVSLLNEKPNSLLNYKVFELLNDHIPNFCEFIFNYEFEHKSRLCDELFKIESQIMEYVFTRLEGIPALYVFDGIMCKEDDLEDVRQLMDQACEVFGVRSEGKYKLGDIAVSKSILSGCEHCQSNSEDSLLIKS